MNTAADTDDAAWLGMLATAISGHGLSIAHAAPGVAAWTDGAVIFVSGSADLQTQIRELCVQSALIAAGSLDRQILQQLSRNPELCRRYLAVEGRRVLAALAQVLPPLMSPFIDPATTPHADSALDSLDLALSPAEIEDPPKMFGSIRPRELLATQRRLEATASTGTHNPRPGQSRKPEEFHDPAGQDDENTEDFATSPVGGGGAIGRLLQKMFQVVRQIKGGGPPGADAVTHWSRTKPRSGVRSLTSTLGAEAVGDVSGPSRGILYPEWDVHRGGYRPDWCSVKEVDPPADQHANVEWLNGHKLRRPLARLGMGLDRFHRQPQGDDIDIDAAIETQIELKAGSIPDENRYIESQRHRRDLSVLILLDISGSVAQASLGGRNVHEQQRQVAAELATVLYEIGDRVALYAFNSQGRSSVQLMPVKRFGEGMDSTVISKLHSLVPGAYSRLGAAIRHGATVLIEQGGTCRRLLVVLSDGLAYDHGYEPAYGAADSRQALAEARRDGVGCLCLSVGASTDTESLRKVFGSAAHAIIPTAEQVGQAIGPLFRSALRSAEVKRRFA